MPLNPQQQEIQPQQGSDSHRSMHSVSLHSGGASPQTPSSAAAATATLSGAVAPSAAIGLANAQSGAVHQVNTPPAAISPNMQSRPGGTANVPLGDGSPRMPSVSVSAPPDDEAGGSNVAMRAELRKTLKKVGEDMRNGTMGAVRDSMI